MQVMEAMAEILKREGLSTLFCYPTTPVIEAAVAAGLRPIICRQERVGVDMAAGYARTTNGKPAAAFAMQYGPGAENAFPGIASAFSDSAPILLLLVRLIQDPLHFAIHLFRNPLGDLTALHDLAANARPRGSSWRPT